MSKKRIQDDLLNQINQKLDKINKNINDKTYQENLAFLKLVIVLMFNPLLYFLSLKLYFDWICHAVLSLKQIALVDLI